MKIRKITLENFRQYAGLQTFKFASMADRPVTIIFGGNGAGKTTLLNAFLWAMYGEFSEDVEEQHRLVSDSVWAEAAIGDSVNVSVEVELEHEGKQTVIRRSAKLQKLTHAQQDPRYYIKMWTQGTGGEEGEIEYPQPRIEGMLPRRLSRFFFFNGERIEKLVQKHAYKEVRQDIKSLLGLEQVERAINHLPKVERKLGAELRKHAGGDVEVTQARIEVLRAAEEKANNELSTLVDLRHTLSEDHEAAFADLRRHESTALLQRELDRVGRGRREAKARLAEAQNERTQLVARDGFVAFTAKLEQRAMELVGDGRTDAVLPTQYKRALVAHLATEGTCICGTDLTQQAAHQRLTEWIEATGGAANEIGRQRLEFDSRELALAREALCDRLDSVMRRLDESVANVQRLEEEHSSLLVQMTDSNEEVVRSLQRKGAELASQIEETDRRIGATNHSLQQVLRELATRSNELKRADVRNALAAKARERGQTVRETQVALKEILEIRAANLRHQLDAKIKSVFSRISIKPYVPVLAEDYSLGLFQRSGTELLPVPKSTGENQILSLSFVAAVSELAREIGAPQEDVHGHAALGAFPIVMDAAFGSLDETYQREVSRILPSMAPQLIVLVSKSQGLGHVLRELAPFVGKIGVIVTHTTRIADVGEQITLDGVEHPYVVQDELDFAELRAAR